MKKRKLTALQEQFCQLYTVHWEATRSAREAGYSAKTAQQLGYQLLQLPSVQARIAEITEHALKELGVTRERVLAEYARLAFLDPARAYDEIGQFLPIKEMPEDVRRAISKVEIFEVFSAGGDGEGGKQLAGFTKKVEFASKKGALDSLGKYLGMAPEKVEHSGPGGKPIETVDKSQETIERLEMVKARRDAKK